MNGGTGHQMEGNKKMLKDFITKYSTVLFVILLIIIALIGFAIYDSIAKQGTKDISILVVPSDAKVVLNDNEVKLGKNTLLPYGTHTVTVSKNGFATRSIRITINKDGNYSNFEPIALSPVSEEATKWFNSNRELYGDFADSKSTIDPAFAYIPTSTLLYRLSSDSTSAPITIDTAALGIYRNAPIDYLKRSGLNPSDYIYTFNYKNPFEVTANE